MNNSAESHLDFYRRWSRYCKPVVKRNIVWYCGNSWEDWGPQNLEQGMPRIARIVAEGFPHHITQRGNRRQNVSQKDSKTRSI